MTSAIEPGGTGAQPPEERIAESHGHYSDRKRHQQRGHPCEGTELALGVVDELTGADG